VAREFLTPVVLPADPVGPMEAATKQYVDSLSEVYVGYDDPYVTNPASTVEAWYEPNPQAPGIDFAPDPAAVGVTATASAHGLSPGATACQLYHDQGAGIEISANGGTSWTGSTAKAADANGNCEWLVRWVTANPAGAKFKVWDNVAGGYVIIDDPWGSV